MKHLILLLLLASCSVQHHIDKMQKHKLKATNKGAKFNKEYITKTDTLIKVINGDTIKIPYTDTIEVKEIIKIPLSRQERKALKDSMNHERKMYQLNLKRLEDSLKYERIRYTKEIRSALKSKKTDLRIERTENRKSWIWIFLLGLICGAGGMILIRRL